MIAKNNRTTEWLVWGAILLLFVSDRVIKFIKVDNETAVINEFSAFSIPISNDIVSLITIIVIMWLIKEIVVVYKKESYLLSILLVGIVAGGLSNLIDRIYYDGVVDYIILFSWFPIFNIADLLISFSVIAVGLYIYSKSREKSN